MPSTRLVFLRNLLAPGNGAACRNSFGPVDVKGCRKKRRLQSGSLEREEKKDKRSLVSLVNNETDDQTPPSGFSYSQLACSLPRLFEFVRTMAGTPAANWLVPSDKKQRGFLANKNASRNPPLVPLIPFGCDICEIDCCSRHSFRV